jgi:2-oxoglutarate ferredoxin oxidoreductase subunit beta
MGSVHKSTPMGSIDQPLSPVSLALGAEATFVARTVDTDRAHLTEVLTAANTHRGASLVEIYQNCVVFNDDFYDEIMARDKRAINQIRLVDGEPITFGPDGENAVVAADDGSLAIVPTSEAGDRIVVHDPTRESSTTAFALSRLSHNPTGPTPLGVFRAVQRPVYDDMINEQVEQAVASRGRGSLADLLASGNTWDVD